MPACDKVLVTGASGFVGGEVCRHLTAAGYTVRGTGRKPRPPALPASLEYMQGDLTDRNFAAATVSGCHAVIHTAARAGFWGAYGEYVQANIVPTRFLLEEGRRAGCRALVYTSTPSVVYHGGSILEGDESLPYGKHFPCAYPATKAEAEKMVLASHQPGGGMATIALRPHLVWGPGDPHLLPRVFARARAGRLRQVGDGRNLVDLTYIDNVAVAHRCALESLLEGRGGGRAFFITQDEPVALWPWIEEVLASAGIPWRPRPISFRSAYRLGAALEWLHRRLHLRGEPLMTRFVATELATDHTFSSAAARGELGYQPVVSMQEGLARYLADLADQPAT